MAARRWLSAAALGALLLTGAGGSPAAAPITTNTALPVAEGTFVWRSQLIHRERSDDGPADRDVTVQAWANVLGYGVTRDLAVFGVVPWFLERELEVTTDGERQRFTTDGLGDVELFARYTVVSRDRPGRTLRVAPLLGVKAPTGDEDDDPDAPRPIQPGTGTWDGFAGVVATYQTLDLQLDGQLLYRAHGREGGFSPGDVVRLGTSLQYRLWPRELGAGVPGFVYAVLESSLVHRQRDVVGGSTDPDSGGLQWLLAPGLQYVARRWIVEGAVQLPVAESPRGDAIQDDLIARGGIRVAF